MKKVEQVQKNGNIITDYDQTLTPKQIDSLMKELFEPVLEKDGKQYLLYKKIGLLACNVTYLGPPHPIYKKRIQLKPYYLDYLAKNSANGIKTFYVGIYTYNKTRLFVVFEPSTYAGKKSHNSSAHVYTINLQYAQRAGEFSKIDKFGNKIHVFLTNDFIRFIKKEGGEVLATSYEDMLKVINDYVGAFANKIPSKWNGIDCYKEMVEAKDNNAKQGEWQGWYFEYLFKKYLKENKIKEISWHNDKKDSGIDLDIKFNNKEWTYGDLKAHQLDSSILGNSFDSFDAVISHGGTVYYICCVYKAEKDSDHDYQVTKYWDQLRGGKYKENDYSDIENGYGKRMKYSVTPHHLEVLKIDDVTYSILKKSPFAQGLNSNGTERKPKLQIKKDMIEALTIYTKTF